MPMDLTVVSVCQNDRGLLALMVDSVRKLTPFYVPIVIVNNGGSKKTIDRILKKHPDVKIIDNKSRSKSTSYRHGDGLNVAMSQVKTEYTAIIESDCAVVSPTWYEFDTAKYDLSVAPKGKKDIDYWYVFFMIFKTQLFKGMDWKPLAQKPKYGDTGWRMFYHVDKNRIDNLITKSISHYKSVAVHRSNEVIAVHFGRGSDLYRRPGSPKTIKHELRRWSRQIRKEIEQKGVQ